LIVIIPTMLSNRFTQLAFLPAPWRAPFPLFTAAALAALALCVAQPAFAVNAEVGVASVQASTSTAQTDEIQNLLASKGLLTKISEKIVDKGAQIVTVGQSVTQSVVQQVGERTSDLVGTAIGFLGIPYRRGGNSAETGFDCSGFVRAIYKETIGLVLPRSADQQANATQKIDRNELKPGDLVFFNTMKRAFSHVGIYMGEGKFIHSPRTGASVRIEDMRIPYWNVRFDGARRVAATSAPATAVTTAAVIAPTPAPAAVIFQAKPIADSF
jgi:cell wall-associated NlpC family hydrolase